MFRFSAEIIIARLIILFLVMPVHEWAHAWSAYQMGDDTASLQGRMTLNPLAHLDPIGSLMILVTGFGWARPVPVNPYRMNLSARTGMALSALAGPASNFLTAMLCAIPFRLGLVSITSILGEGVSLGSLLWAIASVSLGLAVFNMLPFYPLDGEKVLVGVLPPEWGNRLIDFRPYSPYVLMASLFVLPRLGLDIIGFLIRSVLGPLIELLFFS